MSDEATTAKKVVIVGGGITGLVCAYRIKSEHPLVSVTLVESRDYLGGILSSQKINGCLLEHGPDSFITNKPAVLELASDLGLSDQIIKVRPDGSGALVLRAGKLESVPPGFVLLAPGKILPFLLSPVVSIAGKMRALMELVIPPHKYKVDDDESLASFVERRLGREILDRLAQPMLAGIYVGDARKLSASVVAQRFVDMERTGGSVISGLVKAGGQSSGARYGLFASFAGGMQTLVDALGKRLDALGVVKNLPVAIEHIARGGGKDSEGFNLTTGGGKTLSCDVLVLALPAQQAALLLEDYDRDLSRELALIPSASSIVVNAIFDRAILKKLSPLHQKAFGAVIPLTERKEHNLAILALSFLSNKFADRSPDDKVILRCFLGGAQGEDVMTWSDAEITKKIESDLTFILGVDAQPEHLEICRWPVSMPQYNVGYKKLLRDLTARMERHPNLFVVGASYGGVGIPDCVASANQCAQMVSSRV